MRKAILILGIAAACVVVQPSLLYANDNDSGSYVYVESNLNAPNSNSIYAFRRESDGHLTQISGSPFLTGGAGVQYTGSNLGPYDSDQEIIANPQHTLLFAVNPGSDTVAVFLSLPATEFTGTTAPRLPLGLWSHPTQPIVYVGYVTVNKMGVYRYDEDGALKFLRAVPNDGQGICWIRSNKSGTRLYTSDTTTNQISVYDSSDPEYPVEIQTLTLEGVGNAFQLSLSDDGKFLYVLSQRASASIPARQGNVLHTLAIRDDGTVEETAPPVVFSLPAGIRPQGVAVVDPN